MKCLFLLSALSLFHVISAQQQQQYTTPVPILKQINKHNEDGSYSYGYEAADGTFKIETKYPDGEVFGKYGYVDDQGKVREVEYGASRRGFEPTGNDINVAPPTLKSNNEYNAPLRPGEEDDGQYREDPSVYYKDEAFNKPAYQQQYQQPAYQPTYRQPQPQTYQQPEPQTYQQPEPVYQTRSQPAFRPQQHSNFDFDSFRSNLGLTQKPTAAPPVSQPAYRPQPAFRPAPQPVYRPAAQPIYRPTPAPAYNNYNQGYSNYNNYDNGFRNNWWSPSYSNYNQGYRQPIAHEPLPYNVDLNTGSYTLNVGRR